MDDIILFVSGYAIGLIITVALCIHVNFKYDTDPFEKIGMTILFMPGLNVFFGLLLLVEVKYIERKEPFVNINYEKQFKYLVKSLIELNILTKEQIDDLIDSKILIDELLK